MPSLFFSSLSTPSKLLDKFKYFDLRYMKFIGNKEHPVLDISKHRTQSTSYFYSAVVNHHGNVYALEDTGNISLIGGHLELPGINSHPNDFGNRKLVQVSNILRNYSTSNWRTLDFKPDGTKMFAGLNTGNIFEFNLTRPWDLSTLQAQTVVSAGNILVANLAGNYNMDSIGTSLLRSTQWVDNGNIYLVNFAGIIKQYETESPYSLSNIRWRGANSFWRGDLNVPSLTSDSIATNVSALRGIAVHPDGTKLWVYVYNSQRVIEFAIDNYTIAGGLKRLDHFSITSEANVGTAPALAGLQWGNTGYNWYTMHGTNLIQYSCVTPYQINTSSRSFVKDCTGPTWVDGRQPTNNAFFINKHGNILYTYGSYYRLDYWELPTPWELSSMRKPLDYMYLHTYRNSPIFQNAASSGLYVKDDGLKLFTIDSTSARIHEFNLDPAWSFANTSTNLYSNLLVSAQETAPHDIFFSSDGQYVYVLGQTGDDITAYFMSSAWDLTTAAFDHTGSIAVADITPTGFYFKPDGTKVYVTGQANDRVHQFTVSPAWDVQSLSLDGSFSISAQQTAPTGVEFKSDGTKMFVTGATRIDEYRLSEAWNVSTSVHLTGYTGNIVNTNGGFRFGDSGNVQYLGLATFVERRRLTTPWDSNTTTQSGSTSVPRDISTREFTWYDTGFNTDQIHAMFVDEDTYGNIILISTCDPDGCARGEYISTWRMDNANDFRSFTTSPATGSPANVTTKVSQEGTYNVSVVANGTIMYGLTYTQEVYRAYLTDPYTITPNIISNKKFDQGNDPFGQGSALYGNNHSTLYDLYSALNETVWSAGWLEDEARFPGSNTYANLWAIVYGTSDISGAIPSLNRLVKFRNQQTEHYNLSLLRYDTTDMFDALGTFNGTQPWAFKDTLISENSGHITFSETGSPFYKDGKILFFLTGINDRNDIHKINLSTHYRLNSNTRNSVHYGNGYYYVGLQENALRSIHMSYDGGNLYVLGQGHGITAGLGKVTQYTMSAPYTINTATYIRQFSVPSATYLKDIEFNNTGTRMYIVDGSGGNLGNVAEYVLSSPWDISTASFSNSLTGSTVLTTTNYSTITFSNNGSFLYFFSSNPAGSPAGSMKKFSLSTPYQLNTAAQVDYKTFATFNTPINITGKTLDKVILTDDGTKMFVLSYDQNSTNIIAQYDLTVAHSPYNNTLNAEINFYYYNTVRVTVPGFSANGDLIRAMTFDPQGTRFYMGENERDMIYQFRLI